MKTQKCYKRTLTPISNVKKLISKLKSSFHIRRTPVKFTFYKHEILLSNRYIIHNTNLSDFIYDYRKFCSPSVKIYNAIQLSRRISNRI
jgi:hypothetical protein